jgi:periplasmic protein CpxP/Spy
LKGRKIMKLTNKKITFAKIALVALLAVLASVIGIAQRQDGPGGGGRRHFGGGHGRGGHFMPLHGIDLSEEQRTQVRQITERFHESTRALHEQIRAQGHPEGDALLNGTFNEAQVRAAAQARANVMIEIEVARARMMSEIYALLTPEQRAQLAARRQEMERRRQEREARRQASQSGQQN